MNSFKHSLSFLVFAFFLPTIICGQDQEVNDKKLHLITVIDQDDYYIGEIVDDQNDSIYVETIHEVVGLSKEKISTIEPYYSNGKFIRLNRNVSRHILAPTARSLRKGEIYYQNGMLIGNTFNFGIGNDFTLTAGASFFLIIDDELDWFLMPKYSINISPVVDMSFGVVAAGFSDIFDFYTYNFIVVPFTNLTLGTRDNNFTIGFGYGMNEDQNDGNISAVMIGANLRLVEKLMFVSESTFGNFEKYRFWDPEKDKTTFYLGAHSIRHLKGKNNYEYGVMFVNLDRDVLPAPFFGYVRYF